MDGSNDKKASEAPKPVVTEIEAPKPSNDLEGRLSMMIPPPPVENEDDSDNSDDWGD